VDSSRIARGTAVVNLFPIAEGEMVTAIVAVTDFTPKMYLLLATAKGEIKKTAVDRFAVVRSSGLIAMDLAAGDEQVDACLAMDEDDVILVTRKGQSIKFPVASLRASSRVSGGVRAMRLAAADRVVSLDRVDTEAFLLVVTSGGFGKLAALKQYPRQHRAGSGVRTFKVAEKTGDIAAAKVVTSRDQVMIISAKGIVTRTPVRERDPRQGITIQGRSTQGVRLMRLEAGDEVVAVAAFGGEKERSDEKKKKGGKK
jgi:DNA gyrase subunit A